MRKETTDTQHGAHLVKRKSNAMVIEVGLGTNAMGMVMGLAVVQA